MELGLIEQFGLYILVEKKYSKLTAEAYCHDIHQLCTYVHNQYEIKCIQDINFRHIRSWVVQMIDQDNETTTVHRKISSLRTFYKWLLKKKIISTNPMLKIILPKKSKRLPVVINELESKKALVKYQSSILPNDFDSIRDQYIITLFYATGMRRAELLGLQVQDFDSSRQEVRVTGKGNKVRSIPVSDNIIHMHSNYLVSRNTLGDAIPTNQLFITNKGKPLYPRLLHNIVSRFLSSTTNLQKNSPHVLRHSFATHMLDNGADLNVIKEILGHANLAATQIYTHTSISKLKEAYKNAHPKA